MPKIHVVFPLKYLKLELHIHDQCSIGSNSFNTLAEFKMFLEDNPEILKVLRTGDLAEEFRINKNQDMDLENRI